ncbi:MAG TPA: substrate-binding domain-containing protein, partial [Sphingomonas sp.]|nr:substrate-binding domain-containing protein [Sphingomonas sp.]
MTIKRKATLTLTLCAAFALTGCGTSAPAPPGPRQIRIVGSSAVYPFSTAVAERFIREHADAVAPLVRAGGTGAGITAFCGGLGREHPDVVGVTRPMTEAETADCRAHGVHALATLPLGYGALVLVQAKDESPIALTRTDLYRALAGNAENWSDVDPRLPRRPIRVEGPA